MLRAMDLTKSKELLIDLCKWNIERLEAKREVHLEYAEERADSRARELSDDDSPQGLRLARHQDARHRKVVRCRDAFWKHRREMAREENSRWEGDETGDSGARNGAADAAAKAPEENGRNEPKSGQDEMDVAAFLRLAESDPELRQLVEEIRQGDEMLRKKGRPGMATIVRAIFGAEGIQTAKT